MKKILVSMLAVAAMVACSTEDTLVQAPVNDAIGFDTFVDNATRANDVTSTTIKEEVFGGFGVYASVTNGAGQSGLILENEQVTFTNGAWGYTNTQYWVAGNNYNFAAIAPFADRKWTYTPANGTAQNGVIAFNNAAAAANQDLVFATAAREVTVAPTAQPDAVAFTFGHLLSRVRFSFANGFQSAGNIKLVVSDVHITDAYANGTIEVKNGEVATAWTPADKNLDVVFGDAAAVITEGEKQSTKHFYLIPNADVTAYLVTFDVTLFQAGVEIDTYSHAVELKCAMERGASYDIKTTLNPQNTSDEEGDIYPIEFTVTAVEEWDNYNEVVDAEETALRNALLNGGEVTLERNFVLSEPLVVAAGAKSVINLNGHYIAADLFLYPGNTKKEDSYAFWVKNGGELTINGEGTITTADCKYSIAVWAQGGKVTINGGKFTNAGVKLEDVLKDFKSVKKIHKDTILYWIYAGTFEPGEGKYPDYWETTRNRNWLDENPAVEIGNITANSYSDFFSVGERIALVNFDPDFSETGKKQNNTETNEEDWFIFKVNLESILGMSLPISLWRNVESTEYDVILDRCDYLDESQRCGIESSLSNNLAVTKINIYKTKRGCAL